MGNKGQIACGLALSLLGTTGFLAVRPMRWGSQDRWVPDTEWISDESQKLQSGEDKAAVDRFDDSGAKRVAFGGVRRSESERCAWRWKRAIGTRGVRLLTAQEHFESLSDVIKMTIHRLYK